MPAPTSDIRVLQVLGSDDRDDVGRAALDLHRELTVRGMHVRTLALAPGSEGGLAAEVPVMSPSARSLSAHTQLRREQRWADVVVLRGERPAAAAGLARVPGSPPTVLALTGEPRHWSAAPVPSRVMRLAGRAAAVVVTSSSDASVAGRMGLDADTVHVIPFGVGTPSAVSDARRMASRSALGLPAGGVVAHLVGGVAADPRIRVRLARAGVGVTAIERHDGLVHFGEADSGDAEEMAVTAADLVVASDVPSAGPPWELLRGAAWGLALVVDPDPDPDLERDPVAGPDGIPGGPATPAPAGALWDLLDASTGWTDLRRAISAGPAEIAARGAAARQRVLDRFTVGTVAAAWCDLLSALAVRR